MENINLNLNQYSNLELEELFDLSFPYQEKDIIDKKINFINKIQNDTNITIASKKKILLFITQACDQLNNDLTNNLNNGPIPQKNAENTSFKSDVNSIITAGDTFLITEPKVSKMAKDSQYKGISEGGTSTIPGMINPLNYSSIKRAVNIDSRFRPNYYRTSSSDQQITLPYKFENVITMRLASLELPLTFYAISQSLGNNVFLVCWDASNSDPSQPFIYNNQMLVKIPDGNYTSLTESLGEASIESIINAELQNPDNLIIRGTKTIASDPNFNLIYTVDQKSGKSIFSIDASGIATNELASLTSTGYNNFQLIFAVSPTGKYEEVTEPLPFFLGWMLGYRVNIYQSGNGVVNGSDIILPASLVSEGICYITGPRYIFISIDDYNNNVNNYFISAYSDSINSKNIIARINLSTIVQRTGVYKSGEDDGFSTQINRSRNYFGPVNIEKLRITLYDEYGRILNLNNMDWSCSLMFECLYGIGLNNN